MTSTSRSARFASRIASLAASSSLRISRKAFTFSDESISCEASKAAFAAFAMSAAALVLSCDMRGKFELQANYSLFTRIHFQYLLIINRVISRTPLT